MKMTNPPSVQRARSSKDRAPVSLTGRCDFENSSKISPRSHIHKCNKKKEKKQAHSLNKEPVSLTGISHEFEINTKTHNTRTLLFFKDNNYLNFSLSGKARNFSNRVRFPTRTHPGYIHSNNSYLNSSISTESINIGINATKTMSSHSNQISKYFQHGNKKNN